MKKTGGEFLIIAASKNSGSFDFVSLLIVIIIAAISLAVIFYIRRKRKKVKPQNYYGQPVGDGD